MLTACTEAGQDTLAPAPEAPSIPVGFSALTHWDTPQTRLAEDASSNTVSFTPGDAIGIFAYHNSSTTPNFMNNQKVTFDGTNWTYAPVKYWPQNKGDILSFYAYYPESKNSENGVIHIDTENEKPLLTYNANQDYRTDLLTARTEGINYTTANGKVSLLFEHQLARVRLRFRNSWEEEQDKYHLGINYLYLTYESNGTLIYNYTEDQATYANPTSTKRMADVSNIEGYYPYNTNEYNDIIAPFYLIPNFLKGGAIELGIDVYEKNMDNGQWEKVTAHNTPTYIVRADLPEKNKLEKGTTLVYNISYKPSAGITITLITEIDGWQEVENNNKI